MFITLIDPSTVTFNSEHFQYNIQHKNPVLLSIISHMYLHVSWFEVFIRFSWRYEWNETKFLLYVWLLEETMMIQGRTKRSIIII